MFSRIVMAVAGVDMFGFQNVMKDYYGYKSSESDDTGRASKRTFQSNMIQSAFDSQLSMMQAEQAQQYDLDTRQATADLELSNQKALMADTFNYGMQKMAKEFEYQSQFAGQMHGYDLEKMDKAGLIKQDQTKLEGVENRLSLGEQGRQSRLNIGSQSDADVKTIGAQGDVDLSKIGSTGTEERKTVQTSGEEQRKGIQTTGEETRKTIGAQSTADIASIGAQGAADIGKIRAQGQENRATVAATGDDTRKTMGEATRQTAKDRANQFSFANQLAAR